MMPHPDHRTVVFSASTPEEMEALDKAWTEHQKAYDEYISSEAKTLGISEVDMSKIDYLRGRSRWTQQKENYLLSLARQGKKLPNVLAGEDEDNYPF